VVLRDSHLLPAALYKLARDSKGGGSPDPIVVGGGRSVVTSLQVSQPLLCDGCEQRFGRGESWIMKHCARGDHFKLRETMMMGPALPLIRDSVHAYNLDTSFPEAASYLEYFAASVFWRSGATQWRHGARIVGSIDLGPYGERLRCFLLGEEPFPLEAALSVFVDSQQPPDVSMIFPCSGRTGLAHRHIFAIPGLRFVLFVGRVLPEGHRDLAINSDGPKVVFLENFARTNFQKSLLDLLRVSPPVGKLALKHSKWRSRGHLEPGRE
jgi:hypothetical protein